MDQPQDCPAEVGFPALHAHQKPKPPKELFVEPCPSDATARHVVIFVRSSCDFSGMTLGTWSVDIPSGKEGQEGPLDIHQIAKGRPLAPHLHVILP